jgi:uncharacterized protein YdhG (YjbR/CyaY superfamily)
MAKTEFRSVDEYIAAQPKDVRAVLCQVRRIIRKAVPSAVEYISYQMPTYKIAEGSFLCLGGWKQHYSLYPASDALVAAFKVLAPHRVSKGTLRFPLSEPVPDRLIERIAKFQAREAARRAKAKLALRKKRG